MLRAISKNTPAYPSILLERFQENTPESLYAFGNLNVLKKTKLALFCSIKCPGQNILKAFDFTRNLCDGQKVVISGFHSPIEKECLRILLRGNQSTIICPARSIEKMRNPVEWRDSLAKGRLLILSPFSGNQRRFTAELASQRNLLVAALADEVCFIHSDPGGRTEELRQQVEQWKIPIITI
jgi:predicted Rossmann fold nucleotide-binding protein DprA/Smf involved in DNA uptake